MNFIAKNVHVIVLDLILISEASQQNGFAQDNYVRTRKKKNPNVILPSDSCKNNELY